MFKLFDAFSDRRGTGIHTSCRFGKASSCGSSKKCSDRNHIHKFDISELIILTIAFLCIHRMWHKDFSAFARNSPNRWFDELRGEMVGLASALRRDRPSIDRRLTAKRKPSCNRTTKGRTCPPRKQEPTNQPSASRSCRRRHFLATKSPLAILIIAATAFGLGHVLKLTVAMQE